MRTGSLCTVAACFGLALTAAGLSSCASRPGPGREVHLRGDLQEAFGFTGRMLAVDLAESGPVELDAPASRLEGDLLLLTDEEHGLTAIDRHHLMAAWIYRGFTDVLRYPPTATPISLLAMSRNEIHQIDLRHGSAIGVPIRYDMAPSAPFAGTAGTAFVPAWGGSSGEKTIRTINLVTGLEGWGYRTAGDIRGAVVVGGQPPRQSLYFATDAGDVVAMPAAEADARGPEASWTRNTHGPVTAGLTLSGEDLFAASQSGFLYCMDRITGNIRWAAPHETPLEHSAVATANAVYQFHAASEGVTASLWCHDRATGAVRWKRDDAVRFVVEREGKSVVVTAEGELIAVDAKGETTGRMAGGRYFFPTNAADATVYAVSADGFLFKLELGGE